VPVSVRPAKLETGNRLQGRKTRFLDCARNDNRTFWYTCPEGWGGHQRRNLQICTFPGAICRV